MKRALLAKNKFGFVNGSNKRLEDVDKFANAWERCNNLVVGWLLCNMEPDLVDLFINYEDAATLWEVIKERYDQTNDVAYYIARGNLSMCVQGEELVTSFFSRIQLSLDELEKNEE